MKLISWNVNGIRAIHKKGFVEWVKEENPDVLCLQETKATEEQIPKDIKSLDYFQFYSSSRARKGYSGVALFTKVQPERVEYDLGVEEFDVEGRVIAAYFKDFILFNVYFPNGKASKERLDFKLRFYDKFLEIVNSLKDKGYGVIICGDVNTAHKEIDLARPKENEKVSGFLPVEREWIDKLIASGFVDTFRMFNKEGGNYTWWDYKSRARERNVGWRIDYFFVSENIKDRVKDAFILSEVYGSDHCPIGIIFE
ncbi:exodeoxyribonuclease III [Thermotomaculum hydrothermale]|uniref:Exodeoxyribonuclease III n=1 Tax=Thermotomaculum hydrothermale TaxID=981385 RepID=A0A7R6PFC2_9BACT|nr:exodeoxyribonuclease III [Thermotomaculum hydrothermale]BBB32703.1 exodeoxyribonuclease III [Thermotomaculum hydrothermale]